MKDVFNFYLSIKIWLCVLRDIVIISVTWAKRFKMRLLREQSSHLI